ncbi:hypothetical protein [Frankia sp. Cas4]|uniref:hypothetical protein n=1 Tax=Frankia sp. Cas4 TaxID=3073927 RepID=UPI002AD4A505|nr:hypothetical protein [Frankia sp. Cas4]
MPSPDSRRDQGEGVGEFGDLSDAVLEEVSHSAAGDPREGRCSIEIAGKIQSVPRPLIGVSMRARARQFLSERLRWLSRCVRWIWRLVLRVGGGAGTAVRTLGRPVVIRFNRFLGWVVRKAQRQSISNVSPTELMRLPQGSRTAVTEDLSVDNPWLNMAQSGLVFGASVIGIPGADSATQLLLGVLMVSDQQSAHLKRLLKIAEAERLGDARTGDDLLAQALRFEARGDAEAAMRNIEKASDRYLAAKNKSLADSEYALLAIRLAFAWSLLRDVEESQHWLTTAKERQRTVLTNLQALGNDRRLLPDRWTIPLPILVVALIPVFYIGYPVLISFKIRRVWKAENTRTLLATQTRIYNHLQVIGTQMFGTLPEPVRALLTTPDGGMTIDPPLPTPAPAPAD